MVWHISPSSLRLARIDQSRRKRERVFEAAESLFLCGSPLNDPCSQQKQQLQQQHRLGSSRSLSIVRRRSFVIVVPHVDETTDDPSFIVSQEGREGKEEG